MRIELAGTVDTALTHFAMVGLASILTEQGANGIHSWWQDGASARASLEWQGIPAEEAVHAHARRHTNPDGWVQAKAPGMTAGLFSPRQSFPSDKGGWTEFMLRRAAVMDESLTELDWRMIGGLGEPGHWLSIDNKPRPEAAASRWEMVPRNRGQEFMGKRLAPLSQIVAARDPGAIRTGLTGITKRDELGQDRADSRTGTGLCTPQPVDNALAWCALWGLSCFPVVPRSANVSTTPGATPLGRVQPAFMTLPVWDAPVSLALWRSVAASLAIGVVAPQPASEVAIDVLEAAVQTLEHAGVLGVMHFPVHHTDNPSAPERQVLSGTLVMLDELID